MIDVLRARKRIAPHVRRTPLIRSTWLSDLAGAEVLLKLESVQVANSFKSRGAFNAAIARLERSGARFGNSADVGTGTGILAFAALALWPQAKCIATDIDSQAINVARENAAINGVALGHGEGELLLAVADGMHSPLLSARSPFDLIIANILAGPLVELAPDFAHALAPGGIVVLAGLLETQADSVASANEALGLTLRDRGTGEWPVLVLTS